MFTKIRLAVVISAVVFLGTTGLALADAPSSLWSLIPNRPTGTTTEPTALKVMASINNAGIIERKDNIFKISFELSNGVEAQPEVKYSVSLMTQGGQNQAKADEKIYPEVINLAENQILPKEITYEAPADLKGTYKLQLSAQNTNGLMLAVSLGGVELSGASATAQNVGLDTTSLLKKYGAYGLLVIIILLAIGLLAFFFKKRGAMIILLFFLLFGGIFFNSGTAKAVYCEYCANKLYSWASADCPYTGAWCDAQSYTSSCGPNGDDWVPGSYTGCEDCPVECCVNADCGDEIRYACSSHTCVERVPQITVFSQSSSQTCMGAYPFSVSWSAYNATNCEVELNNLGFGSGVSGSNTMHHTNTYAMGWPGSYTISIVCTNSHNGKTASAIMAHTIVDCVCGDHSCNSSETCASCPGDCGSCPCGDHSCNGSETCASCPGDNCCGSGNAASCLSLNAPDSVTAGQSFPASVTCWNTGSKTWNSDSTPHNLGSQNPQDNWTWGFGRVGLPSITGPGSAVTFNFTATAPTTAGQTPFSWKMVEDGVEWFGNIASKTINVTNPPPRTYTCAAKPATGTVYNTVSSYTQTYSGGVWTPADDPSTEHNDTASATTCRYTCASGYSWNGSACVVPPPTNPTHVCAGDGRSATISWTPAAGYNTFYLRTQTPDGAIDWHNNDYNSASYAWVPITPGASYKWWVHTKIPNGDYSTSIEETFSCPAPVASISGSCPVPGTSASVSWPSSAGATQYALRIDNTTLGGWNGSCNPSSGVGDYCFFTAATSFSFAGAPGSAYTAWVHACNNVSCSDLKSVNFNCINTYALNITKAGLGSGTVTSNPAGISCGGDCSRTYNYNTSVTLTAAASAGSIFAGWSGGGCSGTDPCIVTMNGVKTVTATFNVVAPRTYTCAAKPATGTAWNTVSSYTQTWNGSAWTPADDATTEYNATASATACRYKCATNYTWNGSSCALNTYTLTVSKAGTGTGTVTSNPAGISCGADCTQPYNYNTAVTLTATPAANSTFASWSGDCNASGQVTMTANKACTATFTLRTYTLTYTAGAHGTISGTSPQTVNYGASGTPVTPNPSAGYHFVNWSDGSTANPRTDTNVTANKSVTASFAITSYTLTVTKAGTGTGTVTSSPAGITCGADCTQPYNYNTAVTLTATPVANSTFTSWTGDCNASGQVTITANKACTATFTTIPAPVVNVQVMGPDGVYADGSVFVNYNTTTKVRWNVSGNITSCTASGGWSGSKSFAAGWHDWTSGNITANTTFTLSCTGAGGTTSDSGTAAIVPPPTGPTHSCAVNGASATISWARATGYNTMYLRTRNPSGTVFYDDNAYIGASYLMSPITPGASYTWWVHSKAANGAYSNSIGETFSCAVPPVVSNMKAPNWNYAQASADALHANLQFDFVDPDVGSYGSKYQVIVKKSDDSLVLDTGECTGYVTPSVKCKVDPTNCLKNSPAGCINPGDCVCTYTLDSSLLNYNQGYKWSVQVWDNNGASSPITPYSTNPDTDNNDGILPTFTTYKHKFPKVSATYLPTSPSRGEKVKFTDTSKTFLTAAPAAEVPCDASKCAWLWTVPAGATIDNAAASTPIITFSNAGINNVILKVTDKTDGYYSQITIPVRVNSKLPKWQEVK